MSIEENVRVNSGANMNVNGDGHGIMNMNQLVKHICLMP